MHPYAQYFPVRGRNDRLDVTGLLAEAFEVGGSRTLFCADGERWTAARVGGRVREAQLWLAGLGVRPGDRVAVMLGNHPDHIALIYALILSGIVWVPVNTRAKAAGAAYLLGHSRPALFVIEPAYEEVAAEAIGQCGAPVAVDTLPAFGEGAGALAPAVHANDPHAPLSIIYTSGTTGAPKGVVLTHRMLRVASEAALIVADAHDGDRLFLWEPLCHIGGAQMLLAPFLRDLELHLVPTFSASRFWEQIEAARATHLHYLGGILDILMAQPEQRQPARHSLRVAWGAGVGAKAWEPIEQRIGVRLRECYGMTEGSSFATVNGSGKPGSIGRALPWIGVALLDDEGRPVAPGEIGQIVLSTAVEGVFFPGYLDHPEATARALRDGKLYTGDLARADEEGDLYFVGRTTDSMRVRGENVSAWEIERVFATHPSIAAVAAVGVPAAVGEQDILLYVQYRPDAAVELEALAAWADRMLASFQRPRYYRPIERFEVTPSERIRKHLLAKDASGAWDRFAGKG
jgi:crotonobetaine/carnitine-CoA ligase